MNVNELKAKLAAKGLGTYRLSDLEDCFSLGLPPILRAKVLHSLDGVSLGRRAIFRVVTKLNEKRYQVYRAEKRVKSPKPQKDATSSVMVGMDTIDEFIAWLEKSAAKSREHTPRDWSHDHGYARGKAAAFAIAVKRLRKLTAF